MISIDKLYDFTVPQVLKFHGLYANECPNNTSHELTVVSDTYAICHSCGLDWDVLQLHLILNTLAMSQETPLHTGLADEPIDDSVSWTRSEQQLPDKATVQITEDFTEWVRANQQHIMGSPYYDGKIEEALGFITKKGNLCLLPWVTEDLTVAQIESLEEIWQQQNLIRCPADGKGIKRSERIPTEIRRYRNYSVTAKLYTFHRRETKEMLSSAHIRLDMPIAYTA
ncbi:hypothetical protein [Alicyclobacillus sp. SO9]|uniref:hypothetical protein n=1 Tax=Alicyclobacillus sp. SO9 TaxID=2665646 RepID=UPI0018E8ACB0|nr:hypothetical protein [Alicyclobacillus sp. SO9]QQE80393.1 hypothetical protein GI364_08240 [Alicyclobacillus sp. SO9]